MLCNILLNFYRSLLMPSVEEDYDHDLPCCIGRCRRYHHRWILRTVNAKNRKVQRHQQHRVPNFEPPAASAFTHITSIREADCHRTKGDRHCRRCYHRPHFCRNIHR